MEKRLVALTAAILIVFLSGFTAFASENNSFTRVNNIDGSQTTVVSKAAYSPQIKITAETLGLKNKLEGLTDIYCTDDDKIYVLCSQSSRIIVIREDTTLEKEVLLTGDDGSEVSFDGAKGIYVDSGGNIYIADTNNGRIIIADSSGKVLKELPKPDSPLISDDFIYQPSRIVKDKENYTYVLSEGGYYGALVYSPDYEFMGFYGANTVSATVLDTLGYIWDKLTNNDEKKSVSAKKLPYSFVDLSTDNNGYIVTCTGATEENNGTGQIRKISPVGSNILLYKQSNGDYAASDKYVFPEEKVIRRYNQSRTQNLTAVDVSRDNFIYALDKTYGIIYVFDNECNLINAFGGGLGQGNELGLFVSPESVAVNGDAIWVTDSGNNSVTVFKPTDYGAALKTAQSLYLDGEYEEAVPYWQEVLTFDNGNQLAYKGLAMVEYKAGNYKTALSYAKNSIDLTVYNLAYQALLKEFLSSNFIIILACCIIVVAGICVFTAAVKKQKIPALCNAKVHDYFGVAAHPFKTYENIKYKKTGSLLIAAISLFLFFASTVLKDTASGFLFTKVFKNEYNILNTLAQTVGIVLLWSLMNWLVASLFSGQGRLADVFTITAYALLPLVAYNILYTALSHVLPISGQGFLNAVYVIVLIYTFYLLCIGIMTVHDCNFFKFLLISAVTLFGMFLLVFILFMIIILVQQFGNFIYSIFMEVAYR